MKIISITNKQVYEITTTSGYTFLSLAKPKKGFGDKVKIKGKLTDIIDMSKQKIISQADTVFLLEQVINIASSMQILINN